MRVILLAAGYAVRMQPLTLETSKCLLKIGKRTIIDRIVDKIVNLKDAPDAICVITNEKYFQDFRDWLKTSRYADRITLLNDGSVSNETRLGAIKDLEVAIKSESMDDDLLVVAGDNLFELDLDEFLAYAKRHSDGVSTALYDIKDKALAKNFGVVGIGQDGRVIDFQEKPESPEHSLVSTGIYYFPRAKLALIEEYIKSENLLDAPGYYISWLSRVDRVYGFVFLEDWSDIGNIESYKEADKKYLQKGE